MTFPIRFSILTPVALFAVLLVGCQTQHVAYHSTADVPYVTNTTNTQMELVGGDDEMAEEREYVVFAAVDGQDLGYVLLAPYTGSSSGAGYSFANANLARAVPLQRENIESLVSALQRTSSAWSQAEVDGEGTFVEVMHAPEQDVRRVSENVVEWRPAFRFTFSGTPDGPSARMLLGDAPEEHLQYVIEFDEREQISDFRNVLEAARDRAVQMSE